MGIKNSSLTRVEPLLDKFNSDIYKLNSLISMFKADITPFESLIKIKYGKEEIGIPPPKSHLLWLIDNYKIMSKPKDFGSQEGRETYNLRKKLFGGDEKTIEEAKKLLQNKNTIPKSAWYIFEGYTFPDIYIETDKAIFIGEAKRTEKNITTKTMWLAERDQLIRHIDAVLDSPKQIFSFYILENKEYNKGVYKKSMELYRDIDYFKRNMKHRDDKDIQSAFESFIGFVFWEDIANEFNIDFPDKIND